MKIHLFISVDPVINGEDREAVCGATVPQAHAVPLAEFDPEQKTTSHFCRECFGSKYFYAILTGQDLTDLETKRGESAA